MSLPLTTTLAAELGHNTSANAAYNAANFPANFTGQTWTDTSMTVLAVDSTKTDDSFNPVTPGHVSPVSVKTLIPGFTGWAKTHWQGWFRTGGGGGHKDVGLNSHDPTYIANMIADMMRRGFDGLIIDWYGSGTYSDTSILAVKAYLAANPTLAFTYSIQIDSQAYAVTADLNAHLAYIQATYFGTTGYQKQGGLPVISFFGSVGGVDYAAAKATIAASYWINQGSAARTNAWTDATFDWVQPYSGGVPGGDPYNDTAKNSYLTNMHASAKGSVVHIAAGFNGYISTWKQGWYIPRDNGACWLHQAATNAANLPTNCIGLQINWDDYEEGTAIETGIDNGITVTATMTGTSVTWSVAGGTGDETTISSYKLVASPDGINAAILANVAKGPNAFDLSLSALGSTAYQIYVIAIGVGGMRNQVSAPVSYVPVVIGGGGGAGGGGSTGTGGTTSKGKNFQPPPKTTPFLDGQLTSQAWQQWFELVAARLSKLSNL